MQNYPFVHFRETREALNDDSPVLCSYCGDKGVRGRNTGRFHMKDHDRTDACDNR